MILGQRVWCTYSWMDDWRVGKASAAGLRMLVSMPVDVCCWVEGVTTHGSMERLAVIHTDMCRLYA